MIRYRWYGIECRYFVQAQTLLYTYVLIGIMHMINVLILDKGHFLNFQLEISSKLIPLHNMTP